ncbi:MAG TPA: hypothetical protein P5150_09975 [Candidatus Ratteibacteria bacterium]|nr:hypothetical protein [Candidatus Ratteibacteria bacterium]
MGTEKNIVNDVENLKEVIRKTIKETIKEEFFKIRLDLTPEVSDKEMAEIEKKYKEPDKKMVYSEWLDI